MKFMPKGPEDEPAVEQTTSYINHIVTQCNQWEQVCSDWIHDAMLLGNSYAMAYWDDTENVQRATYEGQTEEQLSVLLQDGDVKVIEHSQRPDEEQDKQNAEAKALGLAGTVLVVTDKLDDNVLLSSRNLPDVLVLATREVDPVSLVRFNNVVLTRGAVVQFEEMLG